VFGVKELEVLKKKFKGILELQVIDISEIQTMAISQEIGVQKV
jgi:hypothetical protein